MIHKLYRAVADAAKRIRTCEIYREDVPQKFSLPCFMATIYEQGPSAGINGRLKNKVRMDLLYFPEKENGQQECWTVGQDLCREFTLDGFKIRNRNLKIVDGVLHFMFDVDYREYLEDTAAAMQEMSQNTKMKE